MSTSNGHPTRIEDRPGDADNRVNIDRVSRRLAKLERENFFGDVVIKVKAGKVSLITLSEVLRPEEV